MSRHFFMFKKEFLASENFEAAKKNSLSLNRKYQQLCNIFERQFASFNRDHRKKIRQTFFQPPQLKGIKYLFKAQLVNFISQFLQILDQQSQYQIKCLSSLKDNNSCQFQIIFILMQKVKENKLLCQQIEVKTNTLFQKYSETKKIFNSTKMLEKPLVFYKKNVILEINKSLRDKIAENHKLMEQILDKKTNLQQKIKDFQPSLNLFRKKLIKNKYQVLERITKLINNIKNAYLFLADTIKTCAQQKKQDFQLALLNENDDINYLKVYWDQIHQSGYLQHYSIQNRQWQKLITQGVTELDYELTNIQDIFAQLILHFSNIRDRFGEQQIELKGLLTEITELFTQNECSNMFVRQLLSFQEFFNKKINRLLLRMQDIQSKLRIQRSKFKKQGEMFLTLIKVNNYNRKALSDSTKQVQNSQIINLINQLTFTDIKKAILLFYEDCIFLPNELLHDFDIFSSKRRQTYDSMEISHSQLLFHPPLERYTPLRQQRWLWKQFKNEIQVNFSSYKNFFEKVQNYLDTSINAFSNIQSPLLEKQSCILLSQKEQILGQLILKVKCLQFASQKLHLTIKLTQITGVSILNTMFKDKLIVETQRGKIQFFKLQNLNTFMTSIKEAQQKLQMGDKKKIDKKPLLEILPQQIEAIKKRKQKIVGELPKLDSYKLILETVITPLRIDQIYELFYSDKPFNFYGKEEPCFFSYTGKKAGNQDWNAEKYDKPGPQFYSCNKEVSFKNCPTFSSRKITYTHPIKPSSIPFMPKTCSNIDKRKMFWISNEQLLYQIESQTRGVPYSDHFLVYLIHKISKTEGGVKIQILYNIKWVKDTMMKSQIESNIIPELTQNMNSFINQIRKVLKLRGQIERGEVNMPQNHLEEKKDTMKLNSEDISNPKIVNKVLVVAFFLILLFNLLFFFTFNSSKDGIKKQ